MSLYFAILVGKIILFLTKIFKIGGGSAAPGYYALKIDPNLISQLIAQIPENIVVTGTNGKTTTARLLNHLVKSENIKTIRNQTGSNLERGIASSLISNSNFLGRINSIDLGIWELDEAAFNPLASIINPQILVFLNVFRDQLDRYGEIDSVVKKWETTLKSLKKETLLILNQDDHNVAKLANEFGGTYQFFSVAGYSIKGESLESNSKTKSSDFEAKKIKIKGLSGTSFQLTINNEQLTMNLPIPGIYHIYDFLAAFAVGFNLNLDPQKMLTSLKNYSPAFGRFEKFSFANRDWKANSKPGLQSQIGYIFLIKNPAGATQVFETVAPEIKENDRLLLALNDNFADGTDVSWIWDAEWERLQRAPGWEGNRLQVICSGKRAQDLAVRLKYAGFNPEQITVINNLERGYEEAEKDLEGSLFILPTYTAMLELQNILVKKGIKKHYWREE